MNDKILRRNRFKTSLRTAAALSAAMAATIASLSQTAYASERTTYTLTESANEKTGSVSATFTIGDDELSALGYATTVSIPNTIPLTLSDGKFSGSDYVGVSGLIDSTQTVRVTIDSDSTNYKVIKGPLGFSKDLSSLGSASFSETLSKNGWAAGDCYNNLSDKNDGKALSAWTAPGLLSVSIDAHAFVPRYKGNYYTTIPLTIELTGA